MQLDFIPGTMCDERVWGRLLPHLALDVAANYVSLAGRNDRDSIRRTLLETTAPRANLIGFSMGGYLALEHAIAHPERVASLVIIAASAKGLTEQEKERRRLVLAHLQTHSYSGMPMAQVNSLLGTAGRQDAEAIALMRQMDRELGKETLISQMTATMDRPDLLDAARHLQCPVLIVGAREDTLARVDALEEMHAAIPGSRLEILDCGHMIPLEAPLALGECMTAFFRTV